MAALARCVRAHTANMHARGPAASIATTNTTTTSNTTATRTDTRAETRARTQTTTYVGDAILAANSQLVALDIPLDAMQALQGAGPERQGQVELQFVT